MIIKLIITIIIIIIIIIKNNNNNDDDDNNSNNNNNNPSNVEATFIQSTRTQRFLKTILTLLCLYSLDSSH